MVALGDWGQAAFFGLFAITFGGGGVGGLIALARGRRRLAEAEASKARHPDEPWLWRPDWAAGRIEDSNRTAARFAWAFAAFWNLVSLPAGYFGVRAAVEQGNRAGLVALLFPVAGVGLLIWAAGISARLRRFGVSRLELETRPAAVGRSLAGTVTAPISLTPTAGFRVVLSCIRRITTGSGRRSLHQRADPVAGRAAGHRTPGADRPGHGHDGAGALPASGRRASLRRPESARHGALATGGLGRRARRGLRRRLRGPGVPHQGQRPAAHRGGNRRRPGHRRAGRAFRAGSRVPHPGDAEPPGDRDRLPARPESRRRGRAYDVPAPLAGRDRRDGSPRRAGRLSHRVRPVCGRC